MVVCFNILQNCKLEINLLLKGNPNYCVFYLLFVMKILNAIHAQTIGGVDTMFRNYTKALIKSNHQVALLISDNNDNYEDLKVKKIFKLKNKAQFLDLGKLLWILLWWRPQIVICHSNRLMKWMKILNFLWFKKSIAVNHGISFKSSLNCNFIININDEINKMVLAEKFDKNKTFTLKNIIDIDVKYKKKNLSKQLKIGIYGRVEYRKGFDVLIYAAEILKINNRNFILKIGGFEVDDKYTIEKLKSLAKERGIYENCQFVGVVIDKKDFFKDVDILCVPSREEPFGLVILEGFLHSTLVISSDSCGGKMLIKNNEEGLLFENENSVDLAKKIDFIIENPQKYSELTKNAYKKLENLYSLNNFAKKLNKILLKVK